MKKEQIVQQQRDPFKEDRSKITPETVTDEYLRVLNMQAKQRDCLLGSFDENWNYGIHDDGVLTLLARLPKVFDERNENTTYAFSQIGGAYLNFKVDFEMSEGDCRAKLFLVEVEHREDEAVKHLTYLGEMNGKYNPFFREDAYKKWHITMEEVPYQKDYEEEQLADYLKNMRLSWKNNKELTGVLSEFYLTKMEKLLYKLGGDAEKLANAYKLKIAKLAKKDPNILKDNTRMKAVLDHLMMKSKAVPVISKTGEGRDAFHGYAEPIERINTNIAPTLTEVNGGKKLQEILETTRKKGEEINVKPVEPELVVVEKEKIVERPAQEVKANVKNDSVALGDGTRYVTDENINVLNNTVVVPELSKESGVSAERGEQKVDESVKTPPTPKEQTEESESGDDFSDVVTNKNEERGVLTEKQSVQQDILNEKNQGK